MIVSWLIDFFFRPEWFIGLALAAFAGSVYFKVMLNPLFSEICKWVGFGFALVAVYMWGHVDGRAEVRAEFDAYKHEIQVQVDERHRLEELAATDAAVKAVKNKEKRDAAKKAIKAKSQALPPAVGGIAIPAAAVSVLSDAVASANASGTPSKPEGAAAASTTAAGDSTVQALTDWGVEVLDIHSECRDRVAEWESWYEGLRK